MPEPAFRLALIDGRQDTAWVWDQASGEFTVQPAFLGAHLRVMTGRALPLRVCGTAETAEEALRQLTAASTRNSEEQGITQLKDLALAVWDETPFGHTARIDGIRTVMAAAGPGGVSFIPLPETEPLARMDGSFRTALRTIRDHRERQFRPAARTRRRVPAQARAVLAL